MGAGAPDCLPNVNSLIIVVTVLQASTSLLPFNHHRRSVVSPDLPTLFFAASSPPPNNDRVQSSAAFCPPHIYELPAPLHATSSSIDDLSVGISSAGTVPTAQLPTLQKARATVHKQYC